MQNSRHSGLLIGLMSLGVLLAGALLAPPAQAVSAVGPYYPEPAWDQKLPANRRFVVLTDWNSEAVLDRETGLVWERSPQTNTNIWIEAKLICPDHETGGRRAWRLPSVHELASLLDPSVAIPGPMLPAGHPFTISATDIGFSRYWSATTFVDRPNNAWFVDFNTGLVSDYYKNNPPAGTSDLHIWCVRGGMNADQY